MLRFFTEAFRDDTLRLGYYATSPSESANHMVKQYLPLGTDSLAQIRECYTRAYQIKALGVMHRTEMEFNMLHFLRPILCAPVSRAIRDIGVGPTAGKQ
jgi:hypothetical protein